MLGWLDIDTFFLYLDSKNGLTNQVSGYQSIQISDIRISHLRDKWIPLFPDMDTINKVFWIPEASC